MSIFVPKIFSCLLHPIKILNGVCTEWKIIFFGQSLFWIGYAKQLVVTYKINCGISRQNFHFLYCPSNCMNNLLLGLKGRRKK